MNGEKSAQGVKRKSTTLNRRWLPAFVGVGILVGLFIGICIFIFLEHNFPNENLYNVTRTSIAVLGVITVGGAAVIQFRKQYFLEFQAENDREIQLTNRLTKAIDHLGNGESIAIRMGALFELKRLAEDSKRDRKDIVKIIESFVRERFEEINSHKGREYKPVNVGSDIKVALNILSDIFDDYKIRADFRRINASRFDFERVSFSGANFGRTDVDPPNIKDKNNILTILTGANLEGANLEYADLKETNLKGANLKGANLRGAKLFKADLGDADLEDANLEGTDLRKTDLSYAKLICTNLQLANLEEANLTGANFEGANLTSANLEGTVRIGANLDRAYGKINIGTHEY